MGLRRGFVTASIVVAGIAGELACSPPVRIEPPKSPPLEVRLYKPFEFKADAKAPHQAVLLGTDDRDGSTILPLPLAPGRASVEATGPGRVTITIAIAPNSTASLAVSGIDASTPPAWRAGVWSAALGAATRLGKDVTDFTISTSASAAVTDTSSSGLVATALLAAATGATVDPTATLIGALSPDGTIGPVSGLHEAVRAAIEHGKRRIGYPAGMRKARSATGELVDLTVLAAPDKVELVEIADLQDAYRVLTSARLPEAVPVSEQDMKLDDATAQALDGKYKQWQQRLAIEWAAILQLESAGRLPQLLSFLRDTSKRNAEAAEALHKRGLMGAAYARMFAAAVYAATANQAYDILSKVQTNKIDDAIALLARHDALGTTTSASFTKIGAIRPTTLGGHLQMLAAFRAALRGWVFEAFAIQAVATAKAQLKLLAGKTTAELGSDQTAEAVIAVIVPTLLYVGKTVAETTIASEQLDLPTGAGLAYTATPTSLERMASVASSAGAAGIDSFDVLVVDPYAKRAKLSTQDARRRVAVYEPDYLVAMMVGQLRAADGLPKQLMASWGASSLSWRLLALAASQLASSSASELVARYDSLQADVSPDGSGRVQKIEHEAAFASLLANAERMARIHARAARIATGAIPVQAKLAYQNASVERAGTLSDQLDALAQFWASSAYSQTAVMLARN